MAVIAMLSFSPRYVPLERDRSSLRRSFLLRLEGRTVEPHRHFFSITECSTFLSSRSFSFPFPHRQFSLHLCSPPSTSTTTTTTTIKVNTEHEDQKALAPGGMKLGLSTEPTATSKGSSGENPLLSMRWATRPDAVTAVKLWASANGKEFLIEPHTKGGSNFLMVCKERLKKMIVAVKVKIGAAAKTKEVKKVDDNVSCKAQIMLTKSSSGKWSSTPWSIQLKNTELGHKNCLGESKMTCREVVKSAAFQSVIAVNKMAPARELQAMMKKEGVDMNASLAYVGRTLGEPLRARVAVLCARVWRVWRVWVWVWGDIRVWRVACV